MKARKKDMVAVALVLAYALATAVFGPLGNEEEAKTPNIGVACKAIQHDDPETELQDAVYHIITVCSVGKFVPDKEPMLM